VKPALLAKHIAELTLTKKAEDVVVMNLRGLSSVTDFFVVCSADSDTQVRAIAAAVEDGLKLKGERPYQVERGSANWVVVDYVDVVLHVFHKNTRPFYNLEKLWGDAVITEVKDTPPVPAKPTAAPKKPAARKKPIAKKKAAPKKKTTRPAAKARAPRRKSGS
jgi:ribosome-associated protein